MNAQKAQEQAKVIVKPIDLGENPFDLVIVDEAHHVPAATWKNILKEFQGGLTNFLFLTATAYRGKDLILTEAEHNIKVVYELSRKKAEEQGIIRKLQFDDAVEGPVNTTDDFERFKQIAVVVRKHLNELRATAPLEFHQAMVLAKDRKQALEFERAYNATVEENPIRELQSDRAQVCLGEGKYEHVPAEFRITGNSVEDRQKRFRTLIVVRMLIEGFDHPNVCVVGIACNLQSPLLFEQFVGRAIRKGLNTDVAWVVSHPAFKQRAMFEAIDRDDRAVVEQFDPTVDTDD